MHAPLRRFALLLLLLLGSDALAAAGASAPPGTIAARYDVSSLGASTYSLDLQVPPGTNAMEPQLGLQYNSQQSDGTLGLGFSLTGLSSITRCGATLPLDGYIGAVRYDARDRFCLDGQRLILIGNGSYGAPGTVYHTEAETWTEVVAQGACGSGPCSLRARNKDGWTLEFGSTAESRVPVPGRNEIISWQIARIVDLHGNAVEVDYLRESANLENLPRRIRYTVNAAQNLEAQRAVHFDYENRPNPIPKYEGGARFGAGRRLRAIRTEVLGRPVLTYALAYDTSADSGRSLLRSLQACAADGTCLPATQFSWQAGRAAVISPNGNAQGELIRNWCKDGDTASHDFNGDGRPDLLCTAQGAAYAELSTGSGLRPATSQANGRLNLPGSAWCSGERAQLQWADFNGDQKADLLCSDGASRMRGLLSTGNALVSPNGRPDGAFSVPNAWCDVGKSCRTRWTNFDGDGRADLACDCESGEHRVLVSTGTDLKSPNSSVDGNVAARYCEAEGAQSFWSDFNGDGQSDLHCRDGAVQSVLVSDGARLASPNSSATGVLTTHWCGGDTQLATLDFNGDGLQDLYCRNAAAGTHQVMLSSGTHLASPNAQADGTVRANWCAGASGAPDAADFNGDGLDDIACHQQAGARQLLMISTGTQLRPPGSDPTGLLRAGWCAGEDAGAQFTDFNGDAMADAWCSDGAAGTQYVLVHEAPFADLMTGIRDGLGGGIAVQYRPLTDDRVYEPGTPVAFPLLDVRSPLYVVSEYAQDDGRGASYRYAWRYGGARTHLLLRRWLGFESTRRTTLADGRYTVTRYVQDYPAVGFIGELQQFSGRNARLTSARFTPAVSNPYPNVYQVQRGSEVSSTYTKGAPDYVYEVRYEYDRYGNPALISDLGDTATPDDDVFDCWRYDNRADAQWRLGYPLQHKTVRSDRACRDFLAQPEPAWNGATDLRFDRTAYNAAMDATERSIWDDRNERWLVQKTGYDALGNSVSLTDWAGQTTDLEVDATLRTFTTKVSSPALAGGLRLQVRYEHEPAFGNQTAQFDANGNEQRSVFDGLGRLREEWGPHPEAGDGAARVRLSTQQYGRDSLGTYLEVRERAQWDGDDPAAWPFSRVYVDGMNRPFRTSKTGPAGIALVVSEQTYDALARPWRSSYPRAAEEAAVWSTRNYDEMDRLVRLEHGDGTAQTYEYLKGQLQIRSTLAAGTPDERSVVNHNSVREMLLQSVGRNQGKLRYDYDPVLQTRRVTGPNGDVTTLSYDSAGRIVESQSSDSGGRRFVYGEDGRLDHSIDGNGNRTQFRYDALGRIVERRSEGPDGVRRFAFGYDDPDLANGLGNLTGVDGAALSERYSYTRYGHVAGERLTIDGQSFQQTSAYAPDGELSSLVYPDGARLDTERDAQGNIVRQRLRESGAGSARTIAEFPRYSALNQPLAAHYGNGVAMGWTYFPYAEALGRPQSVQVSDAQAVELQRDSVTWNAAGQLASRTLRRHDAPDLAFDYGYDAMGWLQRVRSGATVLEFAYDAAGNLTLKDGVNYTYQAASNRLQAGSDGLAADYDGNGNVVRLAGAGADWRYGYDADNAMRSTTRDGAGAMRAEYDHDGRRLKRIDANGDVSLYVSADYDVVMRAGRAVHTKYVPGPQGRVAAISIDRTDAAPQLAWRGSLQSLDMLAPGRTVARAGAVAAAFPIFWAGIDWAQTLPMLLWLLFALLAMLACSGAAQAARRRRESRASVLRTALAPLVLVLYAYATCPLPAHAHPSAPQALQGTGLPRAGTLYFSADALGSTTVVTDAQGRETALLAYQPFGALDQGASRGANDFRDKFTGKELDADSGLYYFGARYLHPGLGRFLQPDPRSQFGTPYAYVGNDPLSLTDPDGEIAIGVVIAIMAAVGAVVGAYSGGASVNHTMNPAHWDWSSGRNLAGILAGAAIGAVGGALGPVAAEAGVAVGIAGEVAIGVGENAAFAALGGGSPKEIIESALIGGLTGGVSAGLGAGLGRVGTRAGRLAQRGEASVIEEAAQSAGNARRVTGEGVAELSQESRALSSSESSANGRRALGPSELDEQGHAGDLVCFSFVAGTPIAAEHGAVPVERVARGLRVWARGDGADAPALHAVGRDFERHVDRLIEVRTPGGALLTTPEHPFFVEGEGWVDAEKLRAGQSLLSLDGERVPLRSVLPVERSAQVYNFEVEQAHTYYAGDDQVLVHNPSCSKRSKAMGATPGKNSRTGREVEARMKSKGWIRNKNGVKEVKVVVQRGGKRVWRKLDRNIHMGHIIDAVGYWNKTGYKYGARSKQVRLFMLDSSNYEFEWGPLNSSNGAMLGQTYRPPQGFTGTW